MAYAEGTTVPVEKSIGEIIGIIKRAGATRVAQMEEPEGFTVQFFLADRMIRFRVALPTLEDVPIRRADHRMRTPAERAAKRDQMQRQRARALLLVIKAKVESIESQVETFEEAFLANVVMADGKTLYERVREPIALEYQSGQPSIGLLEAPRG